MIVIPIGHESNEVRRLPWVTFGIMILCFVFHIFLSLEVGTKEKALESTAEELVALRSDFKSRPLERDEDLSIEPA
jgi:hypothetical protein